MKKIFIITMLLGTLLGIGLSFYSYGEVKETGFESNVEYKEGLKGIYTYDGGLGQKGGKVIGVVQKICYAAALIILMYKGVQYMFASLELKADIKKSMIAYAIGAVILFAVGTIVKLVGGIAYNNIN